LDRPNNLGDIDGLKRTAALADTHRSFERMRADVGK